MSLNDKQLEVFINKIANSRNIQVILYTSSSKKTACIQMVGLMNVLAERYKLSDENYKTAVEELWKFILSVPKPKTLDSYREIMQNIVGYKLSATGKGEEC